MSSFAAPQHDPSIPPTDWRPGIRPSVRRRQWIAYRQARQSMTVPTDQAEADAQALADQIDAALRAKTQTMRATGCHDQITAVVEHRPADPHYRLLPVRTQP